MAKSMRKIGTDTVCRVSATEAAALAENGWEYIGKSEYQRLLAKTDAQPTTSTPKAAKVARYG